MVTTTTLTHTLPWHLTLPSDILHVTTEGVHLTTEAALQLGGMIAIDMAKLVIAITPSSSASKDSSIAILVAAAANAARGKTEDGYASLWEQCRAARAEVQSQGVVSADAGNDASLTHFLPDQHSYNSLISILFPIPLPLSTPLPTPATKIPSRPRLVGNFRTSGLKAVNFTQGEVCFVDFCRVLRIAYDYDNVGSNNGSSNRECDDTSITSISENLQRRQQQQHQQQRRRRRIFVDLGCSAGTCVAAALMTSQQQQQQQQQQEQQHLMQPKCYDRMGVIRAAGAAAFTAVVGIDLMRSKVVECRALLSTLLHQSEGPTGDGCRDGGSLPSPVAALAIEGNFVLPPDSGVSTLSDHHNDDDDDDDDDDLAALAAAGSFDWTRHADVDVVYACATCFAEDVMTPLTEVHSLDTPSLTLPVDHLSCTLRYFLFSHVSDTHHDDDRALPSFAPVRASY